jgi:hypothetical protein
MGNSIKAHFTTVDGYVFLVVFLSPEEHSGNHLKVTEKKYQTPKEGWKGPK